MINISPIKLSDNWFEGFALDLHTLSSEFSGYDEFGHEVFDTKRSAIGALLYRLKYKSDKSSLKEILDVTVNLSLKGKNVLLFDDLYRSGATFNAITRVLYEKGMVNKVYILALTKTRSKS
jgi:phosphoribosylpyrophosphate synthetase